MIWACKDAARKPRALVDSHWVGRIQRIKTEGALNHPEPRRCRQNPESTDGFSCGEILSHWVCVQCRAHEYRFVTVTATKNMGLTPSEPKIDLNAQAEAEG
jgi:hypothetical protein